MIVVAVTAAVAAAAAVSAAVDGGGAAAARVAAVVVVAALRFLCFSFCVSFTFFFLIHFFCCFVARCRQRSRWHKCSVAACPTSAMGRRRVRVSE